MLKRNAFEYLLKSLLEWHQERIPHGANDLSVLKSLKLLFLVTAADIELTQKQQDFDTSNLLIETTWDKFYALPLGHVESDVYEWITDTKGHLTTCTINRTRVTIKPNCELDVQGVDTERIDNAVSYLKLVSPNLIIMQPFQLVELTHKWNSWRFFYSAYHGVSRFRQKSL